MSESRRITQTLLSRSPREYSAEVAILSLLVMLGTTLLGWSGEPDGVDRLATIPEKVVLDREYWRLWTGMAVHADLPHFAFNALFFAFFSYFLYGYFGPWVYPVACMLLGGLTSYLSLRTYSPGTRLVGSSGLVYLMAAFWLTMYVLVERTRPVARRLLHAVGVAIIVFLPTSFEQRTSYRTHAIGFLLGTLLALACFHLQKERIRSQEVSEDEIDDEDVPDDDEDGAGG